ncbi:TPA: hypothetical protein ACNUUR_001462 [Aeromonas salmonicida]|uniref:hypothetical protein n=1 Tax=Aeromonas caviae TaxID=648 RepID=UPI0015D636F1|nr:hypothetical protein [Aeromonas caviae]
MAAYSPPFTLTHAMLSRVAEIAELVGQWRFAQSSQVPCCVERTGSAPSKPKVYFVLTDY